MTTLETARCLLELGLSVFPVPRPGAGFDGKTAVIKWKGYQQRFASRTALDAWFRTPQNIAIATGWLSGVVVIDVDTYEPVPWVQRLRITPWRTTTPHGVHYWYRHPGGVVANVVRVQTDAGRLPVDVRGDGGYVIAPGSVHASGGTYEFSGDWTVPRRRLPIFSPDWLRALRPREEVSKHPPRPPELKPLRANALTRAKAYLAATPRPDIGCGSDAATFTAACRLVRGFNLNPMDAEQLLWDWAGNRHGWTREWVAHKVRNADKHGAEERGALL